MSTAYLSLGSNIEPEKNIMAALALLAARVRITGISTFYLTRPVDRPEQPRFINGVVRVATASDPAGLNRMLKRIETDLGRRRTADKSAPRTIDIDILIFDREVRSGQGLTIPDPAIPDRPFLALPLCELDHGLVVPGLDRPIREIAGRFSDHGMEPLPEYTITARRMLNNGP